MFSKLQSDKWSAKKQLIEDDLAGLLLHFDVTTEGECVLRIYAQGLPHGNRTIYFDDDGVATYAGSSVLGDFRAERFSVALQQQRPEISELRLIRGCGTDVQAARADHTLGN